MDVLEHAIRSLGPFFALRQGYQAPRVLRTDYTRAMPIYEILIAYQNKDYFVCLVFLATWATITYTIFLGSLQLSASFYGATSFNSDYTAVKASTILIAFVLVVNVAVWWQFCRRRVVLRPPNTLAATIPCVAYSPLLREDMGKVKNEQNMYAKIEKLELEDRIYDFGVFRNELWGGEGGR